MRRHAGLLEAALEWPALLAAARRARRGKRYRSDVLRFHRDEADRLVELRELLRQGAWTPGASRVFRIETPKPRWITAAPYADRVVHQILCAPLERLLEQKLHPFCAANRKGRGVDFALRLARRELRRRSHVLCLDIAGYFGSIDHQLLKEQLDGMIKDRRYLELLKRIIDQPAPQSAPQWFAGDDLFGAMRSKGLPIGNLTSQHFGNLYLKPLDHDITQRGFRWVRYVDDVLVFGDKEALQRLREVLDETLSGLRLRANVSKTWILPTSEPIKFLGMILDGEGAVRPSHRAARRWRRLEARGLLSRSRSGGAMRSAP